LTSKTEFTEQEYKAYLMIKKLGKMERVEDRAADVIRTALELKKARSQKKLKHYDTIFSNYNDLKKNIKHFKKENAIALTYQLPMSTFLTQCQIQSKIFLI
jgi:UDP-N-acetylglucosamine:LPS N-acetylglucosamine transferase